MMTFLIQKKENYNLQKKLLKTKKLETIQSTCHCNSLLIAKIVFQVMNYQFKKMKLKTENINKIFQD